jgi:archaemetzincin
MRTAAPLLIFALIVVVGYFVVSHRYSGFRSQQSKEDRVRASELSADIELLIPLNKPLAEPGPMDWLATHTEKKQTFVQYTRSGPVRPRGARDTIYVQPLGDFSEKERKIVELTTAFLTSYFSCPVRLNDALPSSTIPADKRRLLSAMGQEQVLSGYVLNDVLKPRLPDDGAAIIALTSMDLWPGEGWNFVFGQASLKERVGVWSMSRFGDPEASEEAFRLCLLRTLKVATHETGHMFSLPHCVLYECNMCGSNHLKETDRHPLALCPECNAKLCWAISANPVKRYRSLEQFSRAHGLVAEADRYQKFIKAIDAAKQDK